MAKVEIRHKCIKMAREAARRDSDARITGRSIYVKRYYGTYRIIMTEVTKRQRECRDIFADAQKLAQRDLREWNRKRHWAREAKRHKVKGAHRMAVSYFYKLLKENGGYLSEELLKARVGKLAKSEKQKVERSRQEADKRAEKKTMREWVYGVEWQEMDKRSPFWYKKFGDLEEYYDVVIKMAG